MKCYAVENHPNDSRATIDPNGIVQTLSSRMGTGGNNTPFVIITSTKADTLNGNHTTLHLSESPAEAAETEVKELFVPVCVMATSHWNAPFTDGQLSPMLCARAGTGGNQLPLVALKRINE